MIREEIVCASGWNGIASATMYNTREISSCNFHSPSIPHAMAYLTEDQKPPIRKRRQSHYPIVRQLETCGRCYYFKKRQPQGCTYVRSNLEYVNNVDLASRPGPPKLNRILLVFPSAGLLVAGTLIKESVNSWPLFLSA